ncbi:MAG: hypothetical protein QE263_06235 [Vampirovibrionales bacterium]|nr:hypothetical protein [Vampirovibrionales bacterium]
MAHDSHWLWRMVGFVVCLLIVVSVGQGVASVGELSHIPIEPLPVIGTSLKNHSPSVRLLYVDTSGRYWPLQAAFGHVALEVEGVVYNFTAPHTLSTIPSRVYLTSVTQPTSPHKHSLSIYAFPLKLSYSEIQRLKQALASPSGEYHLLTNSCATHTIRMLTFATAQSALPIQANPFAAGLFLSGPGLSPSDVVDSVKESGRLESPAVVYPNKNRTSHTPTVRIALDWGLK